MFDSSYVQVERVTARYVLVFFFNDTATTEIYTLSLHDALPISGPLDDHERADVVLGEQREGHADRIDRKSTRLNSSHSQISYAVFCLKKKTTRKHPPILAHTASDTPIGQL